MQQNIGLNECEFNDMTLTQCTIKLYRYSNGSWSENTISLNDDVYCNCLCHMQTVIEESVFHSCRSKLQ
jgi:hypothetical protein